MELNLNGILKINKSFILFQILFTIVLSYTIIQLKKCWIYEIYETIERYTKLIEITF